jgi:hypothetical protein
LLSLPGELRNLIYKFVGQQHFTERHLPSTHQLAGANFLRTCKQVFLEARPYIYQKPFAYVYELCHSTLYWDEIPQKHMGSIDVVIQSFIRDLRFTLPRLPFDRSHEYLEKAQFRPKSLVFIGDFARYDCPKHSIDSQQMHQKCFEKYIYSLHSTLNALPTVEEIHFVDLNRSRLHEDLQTAIPGCQWCFNFRKTENGPVDYRRSCVEMFEFEYQRRNQNLDQRVISNEGRTYTIEKCEKDVAYDYWLYSKRKPGRLMMQTDGRYVSVSEPQERIGVYIYDDWANFCKGWNGGTSVKLIQSPEV